MGSFTERKMLPHTNDHGNFLHDDSRKFICSNQIIIINTTKPKPKTKMKKKTFFGIAILIMAASVSCKKPGCTDPDAENYCEDCKDDNATCQFEGSVVFWNNQATANFLIDDEATALTYYVDGAVVGSSATSVYWTGAPDCGQSGSITVNKSLGNVKNKSYNYSVKDQDGIEYWSGVANFTANTCTALQLSK
jgi:hypothetical protein